MRAQRETVVRATFNFRTFLEQNRFPRAFSPQYNSLPFEYAGRRVDADKEKVYIYGYVTMMEKKLAVVKTMSVHVPQKKKNAKKVSKKVSPKSKPKNPLPSGMKMVVHKRINILKLSNEIAAYTSTCFMPKKNEGRVQFMTKTEILQRQIKMCEIQLAAAKEKPSKQQAPRPVKRLRRGRHEIGLPMLLAHKHINEHVDAYFNMTNGRGKRKLRDSKDLLDKKEEKKSNQSTPIVPSQASFNISSLSKPSTTASLKCLTPDAASSMCPAPASPAPLKCPSTATTPSKCPTPATTPSKCPSLTAAPSVPVVPFANKVAEATKATAKTPAEVPQKKSIMKKLKAQLKSLFCIKQRS